MNQETIYAHLRNAIEDVASNIEAYAASPGKDFTRTRKLPASKLLMFLISEGSGSTKNELLDFFGMDIHRPTDSAFNQQRNKLNPEALEAVFRTFHTAVNTMNAREKYCFLAADGSTATFISNPQFSSPEYYVDQGHSAKGFFSIHINALFDLDRHIYTDALLQPVHEKDEFRAFCLMVDRTMTKPDTKFVFIGDRGYCSYNNIAHVLDRGQFFLFRTKDIDSKGMIHDFHLPTEGSFDTAVNVTLTRSNSSKILIKDSFRRFIGKKVSFDFIAYGSTDTYDLSFRVVRFPLEDGSYECLVTNLPSDDFSMERVKQLYFRRWGIETSFRHLKYTIGLNNFHSYKPNNIKQEIWARLTMYNLTELLVNLTVIEEGNKKYSYKVNFSVAAHICRILLRPSSLDRSLDLLSLLQKELIPVRDERKAKRLQTAHFRKPHYYTYRAA